MSDRGISRQSFVNGVVAATGMATGFPVFIPNRGEAAEELRIGVIEPTTGIYAPSGESERNGIALALDKWNARGGVLGRKVVSVPEEENIQPEDCAERMRKLVKEVGCVALLGTVDSTISLAVSAAAQALGVAFMCSGGHADALTGKDCRPTTFRVSHSTWMETHAVGFDMAKRFGKKWYLVVPDTEYGHGAEAGYRDVAKRIGATIIASEWFPSTATEFKASLLNIERTAPDIVVVLLGGTQFVRYLEQATKIGMVEKLPLGGAVAQLEAVNALPREARVGYWGVEWYYNSPLCIGPEESLGRRFVADYYKRFGLPPSARSVFGYVAMDRVLWAMSEAKSTNAAKLARELENTRFHSVFDGTAYFRSEDHQLMWPMWLGEIRANGTSQDPYDLFNILGREEASVIEQSVAEKSKVCRLHS
ncbi:MAG TPA: ABC transporter substrate-binding protein [Candidatus Baltobacteraceae bacterium]|jgi:branched-chain amino acid transport system substrate-binding protein|nr:ABC transporter substrate-binding protein [Candidatus Baltobacteraceae bacterium]